MHASRSWSPNRKLKWIFLLFGFFDETYLFLRNENGYEIFHTDWLTESMIHYYLSFINIHFNDIQRMNLILVKISSTALGQCSKIDARIPFISFKNLTMHCKQLCMCKLVDLSSSHISSWFLFTKSTYVAMNKI